MSQILPKIQQPDRNALMKSTVASIMFSFCTWLDGDAGVIGAFRDRVSFPWVPVIDGRYCYPEETFDPNDDSLSRFQVWHSNCVRMPPDLPSLPIHNALMRWGMKNMLTWEDAVKEAKYIAISNSKERSKELFWYIDEYGDKMQGNKEESLKKLGDIPWALVCVAHTRVENGHLSEDLPEEVLKLMSLAKVLPAEHRRATWATRDCLSIAVFSTTSVLNSLCDILSATDLAHQLCELSSGTNHDSHVPLIHFLAVFEAAARGGKNAELVSLLVDEEWVPCGGGAHGFSLFPANRVAFETKRDLHPALGRIRDEFRNFHPLLTEACIPQMHSLGSIMNCLHPDRVTTLGVDLRVRLALELADRLQDDDFDDESTTGKIYVPVHPDGELFPSNTVFLDDITWDIDTHRLLHRDIGHESGRILGCHSIREQLTAECEVPSWEEECSQEEDLVDSVARSVEDKGLLEVFGEFFQNFDDHSSEHIAFMWDPSSYNTERIIDERAFLLQGSALYICGTAEIGDEDIERMQRAGRSMKRAEFRTTGRFSVGMNSMYAYSDCPQLLCNDKLHFFDLGRKFVARGSGSRGKAYTASHLREHFPDTMAPFEHEVLKKYPVVFRLPLRERGTEIGRVLRGIDAFEEVAQDAYRFLLFSRHIASITFERFAPNRCLLEHHVSRQGFTDFMEKFPTDIESAVRVTEDAEDYVGEVEITSTDGLKEVQKIMRWAICHVFSSDQTMLNCIDEVMKDSGTPPALRPHGASAVPLDMNTEITGRVHCFLPTPLVTESAISVHGVWQMSSDGKFIPLEEAEGGLWNSILLKGPVSRSVTKLMDWCRRYVEQKDWPVEKYANHFPTGDTNTEFGTALAREVMQSLSDGSVPLFPIVLTPDTDTRAWHSWSAQPLFATQDLPLGIQDRLIEDGLQIAWLPEKNRTYFTSMTKKNHMVTSDIVVQFLAENWPLTIERCPMETSPLMCLKQEDSVPQLLKFILSTNTDADTKWTQLHGLPLFLVQSNEVSVIGGQLWLPDLSGLLSGQAHRFLKQNVCDALYSCGLQSSDLPSIGLKKLSKQDLLQWQSEVETELKSECSKTMHDFWFSLSECITSKMCEIEDLSEWVVLPTMCNDRIHVVPISEGRDTIALWEFSPSDRDQIRTIARSCGLRISHPIILEASSKHLQSLLHLVSPSTFFQALRKQMPSVHDFGPQCADSILDFLCGEVYDDERYTTNYEKFLTPDTKKCFLELQIFPAYDGKYTSLCEGQTFIYVQDDWCGSDCDFEVLEKSARAIKCDVHLLRSPLNHHLPLYHFLAPLLITDVDFVSRHMIPHMEQARLEAYLDFIYMVWSKHLEGRRRIESALNGAQWVLCQDDEFRAPCDVRIPCSFTSRFVSPLGNSPKKLDSLCKYQQMIQFQQDHGWEMVPIFVPFLKKPRKIVESTMVKRCFSIIVSTVQRCQSVEKLLSIVESLMSFFWRNFVMTFLNWKGHVFTSKSN